MDLIIVESPTKARTISKFLPSKYEVVSCFGHIRDLPKSKLGVDVENSFEPQYLIPIKAKKTVKDLKEKSKKAAQVILASDEDREGEAIAWHLIQALKLKKDQIKRIVFHEITKTAIEKALENPRDLNIDMVDAQQARRVLDRLVGYELSPFLWKKIRYGLSAGRVQSVATRLVVEREREIQKFEEGEYWTVKSKVKIQNPKSKIEIGEFEANLVKINNKTIGKLEIGNGRMAKKIKEELKKADYQIEKIIKKEKVKNPLPPFTTSTLQQAANNRLGYSAKQTMMLAQQLYEGIDSGKNAGGLITYMRTDSLNLSADSLKSAKNYIIAKFGKEYSEQRVFKTKSKGAQEAHESIRPTDPSRDPESVKQYLNEKQFKLYQLIWQRMVASQMAKAVSDLTTIDIVAGKYGLRTSGSIIKFYGFLKVYPIKTEDVILPEVEEKEKLDLLLVESEQHFTQPPARYNDASLVKILEKYGIGRPSTYAPTISTIIARGYVEREGRNLKPKDVAFVVIDLLVKHFSKIVDYEFTAQMENNLDEVAYGKVKWQPMIKSFYKPFKNNLMQKEQEVNKKDLVEQSTNEKCDKCGSPMIIKLGRFGKFLACGNYPECKNTKPINEKGEIEEPEKVDVKCDKCGKPMIVKNGRYGKFLGCSGYPDCKNIKPIVKSTGVKCPQCGKGEIVEKKSKRGKTFYACDQYPDCKNAYWSKPTGEKCQKCGSLMVFVKGGESACSNKDCR